MAKKWSSMKVTYPTNKQLWVVERRDSKPVRIIYVFADRWFDVRELAATKLETRGNFDSLFISSVMLSADKKVPAAFHTAEGIFEVLYTGNASSGTLEKRVVAFKEKRP